MPKVSTLISKKCALIFNERICFGSVFLKCLFEGLYLKRFGTSKNHSLRICVCSSSIPSPNLFRGLSDVFQWTVAWQQYLVTKQHLQDIYTKCSCCMNFGHRRSTEQFSKATLTFLTAGENPARMFCELFSANRVKLSHSSQLVHRTWCS